MSDWISKANKAMRDFGLPLATVAACVSCLKALAFPDFMPFAPPLAASAALAAWAPQFPFSQPRAIIAGNVQCVLAGLFWYSVLADTAVATGLAVATGMLLMVLTRTFHAPAAALAAFAVSGGPSGWSLITLSLAGSLLIVFFVYGLHRVLRRERYPAQWF